MDNIVPGVWVISTNPLHAENGIGIIQEIRGEQVKVEFRPSMFSSPPYEVKTRILNVKDLRFVKTPLERLIDGEFDEPWRFDLRSLSANLLVCNRDGQLGNARTDLLPHQISVAHRVVSEPRRRFLIADEVGLGKTIEAGMILYSLKQRGQAQRVLIITPAGLTLQWQEEMEDKFGLMFAVYREDVDGPLAFEQMDYLVASIDTLKLDSPQKGGKREGHKTLLLGSHDWDVIIFDEAHKLSAKTWSPQKTEKTLNYRLAEELRERCRALFLLTGTPHQGDESKFQNLMSLLHENIVFDDSYKSSKGEKVHFTEIILRNRKSKVTDADGIPVFKGIEVHPVRVNLHDSGEKAFHKELEAYLREGYGYADQDPGDKKHKAIGFVMTTFQKLAASSTKAIKQALKKRLNNLLYKIEEREIQQELVYDMRHEGEFETQLAEKVTESFVEIEAEMLERLINMEVPEDAKKAELIEVIDSVSQENPQQLILIFTEYINTQDFLVKILEERYGDNCTAIIRGGMSLWEKKQSMVSFRDNPSVRFLISTEAGGEGINLQFAHIMINYDLPWNPFRLAQRYGRLYRYGQDKVVQVFNLQNSGTIEDRVRKYLETKTKTAAKRLSGITGETIAEIEEGLLGLFEEFLDYKMIYRNGLAKGDIKPSQKEIDKGIKKAEKSYEIAYASLFSKDIAPFNPERFKNEIQSPLNLEDVELFISEFVKQNGRNFTKSENETWEFLLPKCLKDSKGLNKRYSKVTFDRKLAIRHSELEFMALGHAFTEAAIRYCGSVEFGGFATSIMIENTIFSGLKGLHCNFTVKLVKSTTEGEVISFELIPIFIQQDRTINDEAAEIVLFEKPQGNSDKNWQNDLHLESLYNIAKQEVVLKYENKGVWEEDIFCLNVALVEFC